MMIREGRLSRRAFLAGGSSALLASGCRTCDWLGRSHNLRFGVVSDIHVTIPASALRFERALRYSKGRGVDAGRRARASLRGHGPAEERRGAAGEAVCLAAYAKLAKYEPKRMRFWFSVTELPTGCEYVLEARACNSFGKGSDPLVSRAWKGEPNPAKK